MYSQRTIQDKRHLWFDIHSFGSSNPFLSTEWNWKRHKMYKLLQGDEKGKLTLS